MAEPGERPEGLYYWVLAAVIGTVVTGLLPFTVDPWLRISESGSVVAALLALVWLQSETYRSRRSRKKEESEERARRALIQSYPDYPNELRAFIVRAREIFGADTSRTVAFAYARLQLENTGQTRLPSPTSENPALGAAEREAASKAWSIGVGWSNGETGRRAAIEEALRLTWGPARTDTDSFIAAFRLTRDTLVSCYATARAYVIEMRRASLPRYHERIDDDWERFRAAATVLANDFETWGTKVGGTVRVEGPYHLPEILGL
jgi:hypothetical protein